MRGIFNTIQRNIEWESAVILPLPVQWHCGLPVRDCFLEDNEVQIHSPCSHEPKAQMPQGQQYYTGCNIT